MHDEDHTLLATNKHIKWLKGDWHERKNTNNLLQSMNKKACSLMIITNLRYIQSYYRGAIWILWQSDNNMMVS